jgi:hypothetical protein
LKYQVNLYLSATQYRAVGKLAAEQGITFSEAARRLIDVGIEVRGKNARSD